MIKYLLIFLVLTISMRAATITAASASRSDVGTAYALTSNGDTLQIPAGSATWASALTINKEIHVKGAGTNNTILSRAGQIFNITANARVSHIYLDIGGYYGGGNYPIVVQTSEVNTNSPLHFRIDHIHMNYGQYSITVIGCNAWGVIDNSTFYNQSMAIQPLGGAPVWSYPSTAGTTNALVVENCHFVVDDNASSTPNWDEQETFSSGHGVRLVVRSNVVDWTDYTGNGLPYEQHGKGGIISTDPPGADELRGPPVVEIYDNLFKVHTTYRMMNIRGGQNLIHDNTFTSIGSGGNIINLTEDNYDPSGYMGIDQIANSFYWNNTHNGSPVNPTIQDPDDATFIQLDRDYFLHAPDATSGIITWPDWDGSHNGTFTGSTAQKFYPYTELAHPHPRIAAEDGISSGSEVGDVKVTELRVGTIQVAP